MRLVHYYPEGLGDSGVTVALWGWAAAASHAGHEVLVLHDGPSPHGRHTVDSFVPGRDAVEHRRVAHRGRGRLLRHPVDVGRHLRPGDVLVLHEGWVTSSIVAAEQARRARVPYVVCPHGVYEPAWRRYLRPPHGVRERGERRVLEGATAVHLFFHSETPSILALAPLATVVVAPTGIDIPEDRWCGGSGYLAWVGRYDPVHKGLDLLVEALALIPRDQQPRVRLRGYDYRGGRARLQALIDARPELRGSLSVEGPISGDEKREFLLAADGYLLPSRWESHSVALLEVLSLGIPSLVSDALHVASDLRRHEAAVLASPDAPSLAAAIPSLGDAPEVGRRGRDMVATIYAWDRVVSELTSQLHALGVEP